VLFHAYIQVDIVRAESRCFFKLAVRKAIIHPSRNKSFSRSSFRVCIFENSVFLDSQNLILDSRSLILASRNSNVSTFETLELSFEDRVETVNLHLTGTVIVSFLQ